MPGAKKKDLYIAKSLGGLNDAAKLPTTMSTNNPKILVKTAEKMLKEAEVSDSLGDEERAYVLYMKYFNIVTVIKKTAGYKKQKEYYDMLMGQKNLGKSINKAEELSSSLKDRYDLVEAEQVVQKLTLLDRDKPDKIEAAEKDDLKKEKEDDKKSVDEMKEEKKEEAPKEEGKITPIQLYDLFQDKDAQIIMMDVRTSNQYQESHIQHQRCINVPADIIPPGTTVTYIEKALPDDSKSLWSTRGQVDHIILLDWNSIFTDVTIGTTLRTLKDALFKYDSTVIIKSDPLILEGGYSQWLLYYPQLTTNAKVSRPSNTDKPAPSTSLDFDYPDFDEAFLSTPSPSSNNKSQSEAIGQSQVTSSQSKTVNSVSEGISMNNSFKAGTPTVDRSKKPKGASMMPTSSSSNSITSGNSFLYPQVNPDSLSMFTVNSMNSIKSVSSNESENSEANSATALSRQSDTLTREKQEIEKARKAKEAELTQIQKEREQEEKTHQDKLDELQRKIQMLEKTKQEETKNVVDLMRMKKSLNEEFKQEKEKEVEDKQRKMAEEDNRRKELLHIQQVEEDKKRRLEEVEKLRLERKKKEEEEYNTQLEKDIAEKRALEQARESARQEEERRRLELKEAEEKARALRQEQAKIREQKESEARRLDRLRREEEEKVRQEKERKEEEARKQRQLEEQQEKERREKEIAASEMEKEKLEKERKEKERLEKAEQARKEAEEKLKRLELAEDRPKPRTIPSPNLPAGWEKRLDPNTRRYYYINHNAGSTHWEPPVTLLGGGQPATYTTKLKNEPAEPKRGLTRSSSSPNIAKMFDDDLKESSVPSRPSIDRSSKPSLRQEITQPVVRPSPPKKAIQRNLNPVYGSVGRALTGLRNLGNTCYMNSTIQCLNSTSPLVTYFLTDSYLYDINRESALGSHGEVADEFSVIVKALWSGQYRCISPRDFKYTVGKHQPMFSGTDQQDTQEFLTFLLDALHEGLNKVKKRPKIPEQDNDNLPDIMAAEIAWKNHRLLNESIIVELFQGQLKSTLVCLTCRKQSINFQAFMYLSLPIPSSNRCNLQECLKQFLREEKMTGSSRWKCPRCKVERDSVKKIDIWKLPRILLIGLNRFVYDGPWRQKINSYVDFPVKSLDLNTYIQGPKSSKVSYNLYGISNHFGTMDGGHYTAYCRNPGRQNWYKYDDDHVYEMSQSEIKTSAAFVLYYTSIEMPAPEFRQLI